MQRPLLEAGSLAVAMHALAAGHAARREDGGILYGDTHAEVVDSVVDSGTGDTILQFVFDYMVRHGAQSGSDWYVHHVCAATVTVRDGVVVAAQVEPRLEVRVSEHEVEWAADAKRYDEKVLRATVVEGWRRRLRGGA